MGHQIFGWVGVVCGMLISLGIAAAGVALLIYMIETALQRRRCKLDELAARQVGGQLFEQAFWFSEDKPTLWVLQCYAQNLMHFGVLGDPSTTRAQWRNMRSLQAVKGKEEQT